MLSACPCIYPRGWSLRVSCTTSLWLIARDKQACGDLSYLNSLFTNPLSTPSPQHTHTHPLHIHPPHTHTGLINGEEGLTYAGHTWSRCSPTRAEGEENSSNTLHWAKCFCTGNLMWHRNDRRDRLNFLTFGVRMLALIMHWRGTVSVCYCIALFSCKWVKHTDILYVVVCNIIEHWGFCEHLKIGKNIWVA